MSLQGQLLELIRLSSTDLSADIEEAIVEAHKKEEDGSAAKNALNSIINNISLARENSTPICQDTGALIFYIDVPAGTHEKVYTEAVIGAVREATKMQYLRPNSVDVVTGKNSGDNTGHNAPYIHFHQWDNDYVRVRFMQKGGGCENCGAQYRLPDMVINAGRDFKGVRKCVLDAIQQAQGQGCAPGIIGVAVGGDRSLSHMYAKEQLFRKMGERHADETIATLEKDLVADINSLGIGPMGFGGKTTVLDVFIGAQNRHPATYYVSISYMCWANRRKTLTIKNGEATYA